MKYKSLLILFILLFTQIYGQKNDSIQSNKKLSYKQFILPAALITGGSLLRGTQLNRDLQEKSRALLPEDFYSRADNIFPLVPIAQIYAGRYLGFQPKNNIIHQTLNIAVANTLTLAIVSTTKNIVKEERPDQSNNLSFPSGHTAIAFTNAALLYHEYSESNFWYASSGFLFATTTGLFRIANNKHFTSDVLAGAGIGLASGILISHWNPFQNLRFGKNRKTGAFVYPQVGNQIGLGLLIKPN